MGGGLLLSLSCTLLLLLGLLIGLLCSCLCALNLLRLRILSICSRHFLAGSRFLFRLFFGWLAALESCSELIFHQAIKLILVSRFFCDEDIVLSHIEVLLDTADELTAA